MGETVSHGHLFDRWRVRRDGALIFAETMRIDGAIAKQLADRPQRHGGAAIASVLKVPGDEDAVAQFATCSSSFFGEVGASAWNGMALARLVRSGRRGVAARSGRGSDALDRGAAAAAMAELAHDPEKW